MKQIAPLAWDRVAEVLGVGRTVSRCGVRFMFLWRVDSFEEGASKLAAGRFFEAAEFWKPIVGEGACRAWSTVVEDSRGKMRIALDVLETNIQGGQLPRDLAAIVPKCAKC